MRLKDLYICDWRIGLECKSSLFLYREMKTQMSNIEISKLRLSANIEISKLRLTAHNLAIENVFTVISMK